MIEIEYDVFGDHLKAVEQAEAGRKANKNKPLMCRLDGRAFHTFCRGINKPYDKRLSSLMIETTQYLVAETNAKLGYTQSDEISLVWWNDNEESSYMFDGKFQKIASTLAAMASSYFNLHLETSLPEKSFSKTNQIQTFDARVWNVDKKEDALLNFVWRQDDAIKNSISMAAQAHFPESKLHGVGGDAKRSMLRDIGYPWEQEPEFFRMGTFVKRMVRNVKLNQEQLEKIPEKHRPDPNTTVERSFVESIDIGYIRYNPNFYKFFE